MKNRNFVNLNINPCKMCMPMGAVMAFKGIENCMTVLHGSQGCSTYIRRHMAGHFNEPVDIASSSLNEKGTVYGGEENLKKGLRNVIRLYNPEVIGVATTCLAETIGEDISRITEEFLEVEGRAGNTYDDLTIIPVSTPGYGGTQFEGYYGSLTGIVKQIAIDSSSNGSINIIAGMMSPGDIRNIKNICGSFGIEYTMLPDISDTLDAPYSKEYSRMPAGGTKTRDIRKMAGATATLEIGRTVPGNISPGQYLLDNYGIPLYRCPLPIGLESTDVFIKILSELSGKPVPEKLIKERGRLIDAMVDSHKFNGEARAVIFGDPELVYAIYRMCIENGMTPVLVCTGSKSEELHVLLENSQTGEGEKLIILDDTDFETIQKYARDLQANILIGNSDGKVVTEKEGIPLVRIGFPIHDRLGGQRLVYTGYDGSTKLLDDLANTLIEEKYRTYRQDMLEKYHNPSEGDNDSRTLQVLEFPKSREKPNTVDKRTAEHPCYSSGACSNARMHIPVAPGCNISCNYCNRKYDCVNESRPGVTSEVLTPEAAALKYSYVKEKLPNLKVVGIAGPGDALADFEKTRRSIELIKKIDPDVTFCMSTNGLMLPYYVDQIVELGISHVTVTINAIDPKVGAKIYRYVNFLGTRLEGEAAVRILIKNQLMGLKYLASKGVVCKVNIVMIKGVNDVHIEEVVKKVKECGAYITNIMPLIPAKGSAFEDMQLTNNKELNEMRKKCEVDIKQMYHCKQCRADAIGTLDEDISAGLRDSGCKGCAGDKDSAGKAKYTFAVASKSGMYVDQHFGQVDEFYIYDYSGGDIKFREKRKALKYCTGPTECEDREDRIDSVIKAIEDCSAVLALRIGFGPARKLEELGIKNIQTCSGIEEGVRYAVKVMEGAVQLSGTVV